MSDMEKIRMEIGARIKERRLELNMTQEELAAKVGFSGESPLIKSYAEATHKQKKPRSSLQIKEPRGLFR